MKKAAKKASAPIYFSDLTSEERVGQTLRSWRDLNRHLKVLDAQEVELALALELANRRRSEVLRRLRARLGRLQAKLLREKPL